MRNHLFSFKIKLMAKEVVFKEYPTEKKALDSYEEYDVSKCELINGEKNYTGLTVGKYYVMYPVSIFGVWSFSKKKGWMCKIIDKGTYQIVLNANLSKIYLDNNSDGVYFGMGYVSSDLKYSKLNEKQFKEEYLSETHKMKETDEWWIKHKQECLTNCDKMVENLNNNFSYFESLDNATFNKELNRVVESYHFKEIKDITSYKNCLYILVFDEYKQFYVGKSVGGLKNRTRKHWNAKIIPDRQLWNGGFEASRIKVDNFKMFDTTRIFVCEEIEQIITENKHYADDPRIENTNTFGIEYYENMTNLDKAERIVINDCLCKYCLSDRTPLLSSDLYDELEMKHQISRDNLRIRDYIRYEDYKPLERTPERLELIARSKTKKKAI